MNESLFKNFPELDIDYLDAAYGNDAETAALVFEQYLQDLPANMNLLNESIRSQDIESFRHHIHKQKPGFSYVGLTDVSRTFQELQVKCLAKEDISRCKTEIDQVVSRIHAATPVLQKLLAQLQGS
ncbi:MAG: Hpt domain-containing protein [Flavisolibacter sp.]